MPAANVAMLNADGSAKVNANGEWVVTDGSGQGGGCGPPSCTGCPCCADPAHPNRVCAPPGVNLGETNLRRVQASGDRVISLAGQQPQSFPVTLDQVIDVRCGDFTASAIQAGITLQVIRSSGIFDFPSDPGPKRWEALTIHYDGTAVPARFYFRPGATWWTFNGLDKDNPTLVNGPAISMANVQISPCLTHCDLDWQQTFPGGTETRASTFDVEGAWLLCPSSADAPASGESGGCSDCNHDDLVPA